jgi:alkanesulfonate monooxygenase SsuD/methylene tetrahydromethanopterin reductase-like flavin-dependent oxidoreductase (luciferase family)
VRFSHRGRFWQFEDILVEPPPAQRPHPPLWVAAASGPSIRRAAEGGFNLLLDQYAAPAEIGERIALYRSVREANGHGFDPMQVAVARQLHVARDEAEAKDALALQARVTRRTVNVSRTPGRAIAGSHVLAYAAQPGETEAHALYDTPERIADRLGVLRRAGAEYVLLTTLGGAEQLRRFAGEVMPRLRTGSP